MVKNRIEKDNELNLRIYSLKKIKYRDIEVIFFFYWNEVNVEGKYGSSKCFVHSGQF